MEVKTATVKIIRTIFGSAAIFCNQQVVFVDALPTVNKRTNVLYAFNGTLQSWTGLAWVTYTGSTGGALVDLSDVDATDIGNDKILVYNSTTEKHEYQAKPTGGGGGGSSDTPQVLEFATEITPVLANGNIMTVTMTEACTINIPSDCANAKLFEIRKIGQYKITWGAGYSTPGGVDFAQTGVAGSVDRYIFRGISDTQAELLNVLPDLQAIV